MRKLFTSIIVLQICLYGAVVYDDPMKEGERIYKETCAYCHGINGKPATDTTLVVNPRDLNKIIKNEEQNYLIIRDGAKKWGAKAEIMPGFKDVYDEEQLRAVSKYISKTFNPHIDKKINDLMAISKKVAEDKKDKMLKKGKKIYKRNCRFCHGESGKGDGVATKNPVDSIYPYDLTKTLLTKDQLFLYTKYGSKYFGTTKDDMPSWKRKYDDFTLKSVSKYIDEVLKNKQ